MTDMMNDKQRGPEKSTPCAACGIDTYSHADALEHRAVFQAQVDRQSATIEALRASLTAANIERDEAVLALQGHRACVSAERTLLATMAATLLAPSLLGVSDLSEADDRQRVAAMGVEVARAILAEVDRG